MIYWLNLLPIKTATVIAPASRARLKIQQHSLPLFLIPCSLVLVYSFSPLEYMSYKYGRQGPHKPKALLVLINWNEVLSILFFCLTILCTHVSYDARAQVS